MRRIIILLALVLAVPALAQYWGHYVNARFGYEIDVPPGFEGNGESDNGDGQRFYRLDAEQGLTVWGGHLPSGLEDEAAARLAAARAGNWVISRHAATPYWASLSGQRDHRIFHTRLIALCDSASYAAFTLEYNIRDLSSMDAVIAGLERSFAATGC